ncbi:BnaCnng29720D [Brassica napus]|uniref:BnaCnng29720D protein n=1 Tax=Brassica napus TaxID=3708 RepID=A0A078IZP7_BRANA|nr:BnaCnng29720D [Brassica napus]
MKSSLTLISDYTKKWDGVRRTSEFASPLRSSISKLKSVSPTCHTH